MATQTLGKRAEASKVRGGITHTSFVEKGAVVCKDILVGGELVRLVVGVLAVARRHCEWCL